MSEPPRSRSKSARLQDLAKRAGVSISTVSRALNDSPSISRRTKQTIWELAREYDYPFRPTMPQGPIGAEATIAVVVPLPQARGPLISDPFLFELLTGLAEAARERSCNLLVSHLMPRSPEDIHYAMSTCRSEGVVFIGQSFLHHAFNKLVERDRRFVVWGSELPGQDYCCVGSDNLAGGRRAAAHLIRLGRKRLAFLGHTEAPEAAQRYRGFEEAHRDEGLVADAQRFIPAPFEIAGARVAMETLLERDPHIDGVVAASDLIAIAAIQALVAAGRHVPGDVSVVGYDNISASPLVTPALSTVAQDTVTAGRLIVAKVLDTHGSACRSERLQTPLVIRQSCGA